ncbi:MAG: RNA 2',3'-cyclic phosphodiesterase [Bacteroidales bacterium]|nr:RNA 2',3'-cyclic phosphodiesterase [Bacteroidales bacterium]
MKRIFAAIKINPNENFLQLFYRLKHAMKNDKIKWVAEENIHITLKFFGETDEKTIASICEVLDDVSCDFQAFTINFSKVGIFGSSYKPRVIWFGIESNAALLSIEKNLNDKLERIGIKNDRQNFVPHLTIARIKSIWDKKSFQREIHKYKNIEIQNFHVEKIILFESILRPQGPKYEIIESFNLA